MRFRVIDKNTGKEANPEEIALNEEWAKKLVYCDMEGFYLGEDGSLILADECGNYAYCPDGRFEIILEKEEEPMALAKAKVDVICVELKMSKVEYTELIRFLEEHEAIKKNPAVGGILFSLYSLKDLFQDEKEG